VITVSIIDQSIILNRRRDGTEDLKTEELKEQRIRDDIMENYEHLALDASETGRSRSSRTATGSISGRKSRSVVLPSDRVTKIYGCATMWHENLEEMMEMLKSIFRLDMDYSARHLAQKYLDIVDPDFYEWETQIFFDDAMELGDNEDDEQVVNSFVKLLVR
jgi:chitin synthase